MTGLYSVLFAILAFSSDPLPAYLRDPLARWLGSVAVAAFFLIGMAYLGALIGRVLWTL